MRRPQDNAHSRQSHFIFYLQENMAQPDPLSLTLRDFITLSQLCFFFLSPLFLDHLIQHHQTEDAQAHTMPVTRKITIKLGLITYPSPPDQASRTGPFQDSTLSPSIMSTFPFLSDL